MSTVDPDLAAMPSHLNCRPAPIDGEAWADYLSRVAQENVLFGGLQGLARLLGMSIHRLVVASPADLLPRLGIAVPSTGSESLTRAADSRFVFLSSFGRTLQARVCPLCLSEDEIPYIRAEWGLPMSVACTRHGVLLADRCCACGDPLNVLRPALMQCRCGADLRQMRSADAGAWVERLRDVFAEAYERQPIHTFARAHPVGQAAARTCGWLAAHRRAGDARRALRLRQRDGFLTMQDATAMGPLLEEWPDRIAASVIAEADFTSGTGCERLADRLGVAHFARMREVMAELRSMQKRSRVPSRGRTTPFAQKQVFGIKDLMRATGHSYGTLVRCIDDGGMPGVSYAIDSATGLKTFDVPHHVYQSIAQAFQQTNSIEVAAAQVGCEPSAMRGLVRSGCVEAKKLPLTRMGRIADRVCPTVLHAFATYLFQRAKLQEASPELRVHFSSWVPGAYDGTKIDRWRRLLEAVRQCRVPIFTAVSNPIALDDLYLLRADVLATLRTRRIAG